MDEAISHPSPPYALDIFFGEQHAAVLTQQPLEGAYQLAYTDEWLASEEAFAFAPSLAMDRPIESGAVRRFLENLLPEGRALDVASVRMNIEKSNVFALVRELGRETTGALTFLPAGKRPDGLEPTAREISPEELQARITERNQTPFNIWDGKIRMSVAGLQDKLLVRKAGERLFLVDGSLASTHLLKPEPMNQKLVHMVANEHFCMRLAAAVSERVLPRQFAAEVEILRVPDPVLVVRRFDRSAVPSGDTDPALSPARRHHIIDGCQLLDLPPSMKYERNLGSGKDVQNIRDGVSFPRLFAAQSSLAVPTVAAREMSFWSILTLLLGNSDAHGKNISFHVGPAGIRVAELYDLVSVLQYDPGTIDHELAMAFGDEFELAQVKSYALADHCLRCGLDRPFFARLLTQIAKAAAAVTDSLVADPVYTGSERKTVETIAGAIKKRAEVLVAAAPDIPKHMAEHF